MQPNADAIRTLLSTCISLQAAECAYSDVYNMFIIHPAEATETVMPKVSAVPFARELGTSSRKLV